MGAHAIWDCQVWPSLGKEILRGTLKQVQEEVKHVGHETQHSKCQRKVLVFHNAAANCILSVDPKVWPSSLFPTSLPKEKEMKEMTTEGQLPMGFSVER